MIDARRYTWAAGRQLQAVETPMTPEECAACVEGVSGDARLVIEFSGSNVLETASDSVVAAARFVNGDVDMTSGIPAAMFAWTRDSGDAAADAAWNAQHAGMKQITVSRSELSGTAKYSCTLQPFESYGTMTVDSAFMVTHTPAEADADDVFSVVNGDILVDTDRDEGVYGLEAQRLVVETILGSAVTASVRVYTAWPDKSIEFKYNASGLRVQKKVTAADVVTTTDYVLHGKLVVETVVTKSVGGEPVDIQRLHFFYDAQSRPAMVEHNGVRYAYVLNLQGDVTGILNSEGSLVAEYKYDAWGKPIDIMSTLTTNIGKLNPFRYRGYAFDEETQLYYLRSKFYDVQWDRFINCDSIIVDWSNCYTHCLSSPINYSDLSGMSPNSFLSRVTEKIRRKILSKTNYIMKCVMGQYDRFSLMYNITGDKTKYSPKNAHAEESINAYSNSDKVNDDELAVFVKLINAKGYKIIDGFNGPIVGIHDDDYHITVQNKKDGSIRIMRLYYVEPSTTWGDLFNAITATPTATVYYSSYGQDVLNRILTVLGMSDISNQTIFSGYWDYEIIP